MEIYTDWFIRQGSTHHRCEDYVMSGNNYIVLADGCSTARYINNGKKVKANTDIGAMILCSCVKWLFDELKSLNGLDYNTIGNMINNKATILCQLMGINIEALKATLLFAYCDIKSNKIKVFRYGDGYSIFESQEILSINKIEYENNAPYYLAYKNSQYDHTKYIEKYSGIANSYDSILDNTAWYKNENAILYYEIEILSDCVFTLMSDGVSSFKSRDSGRVLSYTDIDVIKSLTTLVPGKGEFVKRRCNVAFKQFNDLGIYHIDDLSIASLYIRKDK